jgi:hypothetical protein
VLLEFYRRLVLLHQLHKYLRLAQAITHRLLALNPLGLPLLAAAAAAAVLMVLVRLVVVVVAQLHYGFTLVDLLLQQHMPMPLVVVALVV